MHPVMQTISLLYKICQPRTKKKKLAEYREFMKFHIFSSKRLKKNNDQNCYGMWIFLLSIKTSDSILHYLNCSQQKVDLKNIINKIQRLLPQHSEFGKHPKK